MVPANIGPPGKQLLKWTEHLHTTSRLDRHENLTGDVKTKKAPLKLEVVWIGIHN